MHPASFNARQSPSPTRSGLRAGLAALVAASGLVAAFAFFALPAGAWARPSANSHRSRGCAKLTVDFFPKRVTAGQGVDLDFSLTNCSSHREHLVVVLSARSPCPFITTGKSRYDLGPNEGVGSSGLFIAPDCHGHYSVKATVLRHGKRLDQAVTGFTVVPADQTR
jgi:hypothetical protein